MSRPLRVVHLTHGALSGGAAKGAVILHKGLLEAGVDSRMVVSYRRGAHGIPQAYPLADTRFKHRVLALISRLEREWNRDRRLRRVRLFSMGLLGSWVRRNPQVRAADVLHLHFVDRGMLSVGGIGRFRQPVVWTLRDMWPFTGGCHYSLDCDRYDQGCGRCPMLGSNSRFDRSAWGFHRKVRSFSRLKSLHPVGISPWIAEEARKSRVFEGREVSYIWNAIDRSRFPLLDQAEARGLLGLEPDVRYVAVGANNVRNPYKGYDVLVDALRGVRERATPGKVRLLVFGRGGEEVGNHFAGSTVFGLVDDDKVLNRIYAASDCFVLPSRQEAFGKTVAEALASGTPVVCFDACGPKDMIRHGKNGLKAKPFDANDLGGQILRAVAGAVRLPRPEISESAEPFSHLRAGRLYKALYDSITLPQK